MDSVIAARSHRYGILATALLIVLFGGLVARITWGRKMKEASANYTMSYPKTPVGWKEVPHSPQTLFAYQNPVSKLIISGSVNQMVEDYNPTPDLGADRLAEDMIRVTHDNMPGWTAEKLGAVDGQGMHFQIIRRQEKAHLVVTAFAVRGNTTILVSFSGRNDHIADVDKQMGDFKGFLSNCKLTRTDLSNL